MKRAIATAAIWMAMLCGIAGGVSAAPADPTVVRRWIEDVILGSEYGDDSAICARWTKAPTLSVFQATPAQHALIGRTVAELNATLARTSVGGVKIVAPETAGADIHVYFLPIRDMPHVAKENGFPYHSGNRGYFWMFWNGKHELTRAVVLLATDLKYRKALPHLALEEITQSLGLSGDSRRLPDSIFYTHDENYPEVNELSALDRKLIAFFYTHIRPGATPREVRRAFAAHWRAEP